MKYLLDSNICIHFFRGNFHLDEKISAIGTRNCAISEITLAELVYGAEYSSNPSRNLLLISEFTNRISILPIFEAIPEYGKQKAKLRKSGLLISDFDLLIGSTAIAKKMIMVTENIKEFTRMNNIEIENWVTRK